MDDLEAQEKKERRGMVFIHNHISIRRRDGFQQNGFMSSLFPFCSFAHSCILIISIFMHTWDKNEWKEGSLTPGKDSMDQ